PYTTLFRSCRTSAAFPSAASRWPSTTLPSRCCAPTAAACICCKSPRRSKDEGGRRKAEGKRRHRPFSFHSSLVTCLRPRRCSRRRLCAVLPVSASGARAGRPALFLVPGADSSRGGSNGVLFRARAVPVRRLVDLREPARFRRDADAGRGGNHPALLRVP